MLKQLLNFGELRRAFSVVTLALMDAAALVLGFLGAEYLVGGVERAQEMFFLAPLLIGGWVVIFAAHDLYDKAPVRRNPGALVGAALLWAGLVVFASVIYPESGLLLGEILLSALFGLLLAGLFRFFFEQGIETIYRRGLGQVPALLVGEAEGRDRLRRAMEERPGAYTPVGELGAGPEGVDVAELRATLDGTGARAVVLAGAERLPDENFFEVLRSVRLRGLQVRVLPGAVSLMRSRPVVSESVGLTLLVVGYPQLDNAQRALKRTLDVTGSLLGLVVLSPLLLAVALAVRLDSPGPALFRQKRVGADEKVFICYMFRSMYQDAEKRQAELEAQNEADGAVFKIKEDPRITRVGNFIRRWSIDELPQLINVLKGEMSLVGPRPLPLRDFQRMGELHKRRLAAIPGMTGFWQISGRSELSFEDMVKLDLHYIENWSLSFDVKIILKTIGAVLRKEGAY